MAINGSAKPASAVPPALQLPDDDTDKLSDYVPISGEMSRAPTASASHSKAASEEVSGGDEDDELDEEPDTSAVVSPSKKTARQLEKEREKAERREARGAERSVRQGQASALDSTREEMAKSKLADSMKRFSYLLGQTELFQHFIDIKKERDPEFRRLLEESQAKRSRGKGKKAAGTEGGTRRRKTEKEEDEELLGAGDEEDEDAFVFDESPSYVKGGTMRDYQVQGLNWMM
jgi:SWI/SNF-related matrix-associated actin-dependent regulator of chromatin subfamily A member 5